MASRKNSADREVDLHGYTASEARSRLNVLWSTREWHGLQRIRVIHGTGSVLHALVKLWSEEKGMSWTVEPHNPGVTILHPGRRLQTPPAPAHRPLASLKRELPREKRKEAETTRRPASHVSHADADAGAEVDDGLTDEERMKREFDRLGVQDALTLFKRKRDLLAPRESQHGSQPDEIVAQPRTPGPQSDPDLMAQEFARLGEEPSQITRKRKGRQD